MRLLARHLHSFGDTARAQARIHQAGAMPTLERLRLDLTVLMGPVGCRGLMARAKKLAAAEVPWLDALQVSESAELEGLPGLPTTLNPRDVEDGELALLSQLIGLLVTFIGPSLTLRLIKQIWPQLAFGIADFSAPPTHEED